MSENVEDQLNGSAAQQSVPSDMGFRHISRALNAGEPVRTPWLGSYLMFRRAHDAATPAELFEKLASLGAPASPIIDRFRGAMLGLAIGDALGTTLEFAPRDQQKVTDIVGGGPFELLPGQWTDDTSMACCLAYSLIKSEGFDPKHQMESYVHWYLHNAYSPTGRLVDIGNTVRQALDRFLATGEPFAGSTAADAAGNGSLMRLAPVALFFHPSFEKTVHFAGESSRTTHQAREAIDACRYLGALLHGALAGVDKQLLLSERYSPVAGYWDAHPLSPAIEKVACGSYRGKERGAISSSGYVVHTLEAALWAFARTTDFRAGALDAVNLAGDADTVGAVYGQLAGAFYGETGIPADWIAKTQAAHGFYHFAEDLLHE